MPNRTTDALFIGKIVLAKAKGNFKLYITRNKSSEELKVVNCFDALDKMDSYDEALLLRKYKSIKKQQLSNLKSPFIPVLSSLRLITD